MIQEAKPFERDAEAWGACGGEGGTEEQFWYFLFFLVFSMIFWPKSVPEHAGSIADHSDKV